MPSVSKSSSNAGIHPYLKKDFEWPEPETHPEKVLCDIDDDEFIEAKIEECRKKRTFHFQPNFEKAIGLVDVPLGGKKLLNKNVVFQIGVLKFPYEQLKRWSELKEEDEIKLVNLGNGYWLAETIWIKAK